MTAPDVVARRLSELQERVIAAGDLDLAAGLLVDFAVAATGAVAGSLTVLRRRQDIWTLGTKDARVHYVDDVQLLLGEGPAMRPVGVDVVTSTSVADDPRWPGWGHHAAVRGLRGVLAADLVVGDARVATLCVYGGPGTVFGPADVDLVGLLARQGAGAVATLRAAADLRRAAETRELVTRAQGVVEDLLGLDAAGALWTLHRMAQEADVPVREVAERVVASGALPPGAPRPF